MELRYFRDRELREVDFVVVREKKPVLFCEVKTSDLKFSPQLHFSTHPPGQDGKCGPCSGESWQDLVTGLRGQMEVKSTTAGTSFLMVVRPLKPTMVADW